MKKKVIIIIIFILLFGITGCKSKNGVDKKEEEEYLKIASRAKQENYFIYFSDSFKWGMSIDEVQDIRGKAEKTTIDKRTYLKYDLEFYNPYYNKIKYYCYCFLGGQLRSYFYNYYEDNATYDDYVKIKELLVEKYGEPTRDKTSWIDNTYKNDKEKWNNAFKYEDFTIYTEWKLKDFTIRIVWDYNDDCYVGFFQKKYESLM